MTSSPVAASGMTIAAAGAGGGMLTGDAGAGGGLEGLFAAMMGGEAGAVPLPTGPAGTAPVAATGEGMISVLLGVQAGGASALDPTKALALGSLTQVFTDAPVSRDVQLGNGPVLTLTGDAATISAFVDKLQDVYKQLTEGGLTIGQLSDSKELAGALTKMGMAPEEAVGVAERIQTMLKLLEQQQDVDDATAGSLVAMMLTVMGQQQMPVVQADGTTTEQAPAFGLQIVSAENTPVAAGAGGMTAWKMQLSGPLGGDVTRDLLGLGSSKAGAQEAVVPDSDKGRKVEVALTTDGDGTIAMALPDVKAPASNVPATDATPSAAAQAAVAVTTTGTAVKVMADEKIEAPKGDTYYKLQADKKGVETLEAVKPMTEVHDGSLTMAQPQATPAQIAAAAATAATDGTTGAGFAERVAQIQDMVDKAQVGKQVMVQMQPLMEQGGGTVRINLKPRELGSITVELNIANGQVHGSIAASEPAVVEQLARELHSLRHGLADAGLKLGEQGISLMLNNQGNQQAGQQGQQAQDGQAASGRGAGAGTTAGTGSAEGETLASNLAAWVAPDRMLDVNV